MSLTHDNGNMDMPHDMPMVMNMVMRMNFYWGKDVTILFKGWPDNNLGMYILSLLFVLFMGFGVEIMSMSPMMIIKRTTAGGLIQDGICYTARMVLAYCVMLAVMSFNIGIFVAAILGHGLGYVFVQFRERSAADTTGTNATDPKV